MEVYVIQPSDGHWKSYVERRGLDGRFQSYKRVAEQIEFPNVAEGFDRIFVVADGEVKLRMEPPRPEILEPAREELAKEAEAIRQKEKEGAKRANLLESMKERKFWHYCEVCGKKAFITAQESFDSGWDYPPHIGQFGILSPRTCGNCLMINTLYWRIITSGRLSIVCEDDLSPKELIIWRRIKGEPESLLLEEKQTNPE